MKKAIAILCILTALCLISCSGGNEITPGGASESEESKVVREGKREPIPEGAKVITNSDYKNSGKMGDNDGPAYCVYSEKGFNKASMDVSISKINANTVRKDGRFVNAYMFLGCDVYDGAWWCNCFDAGFCYSGNKPQWHLFYNIYQPAVDRESTWFESGVNLDGTHDYRLILDTSGEDEKAVITVWDITENKKADEKAFSVKDMKKDGSNTAYLMDFALDYPENLRKDAAGKDTDDWSEITLYNTDENLYIQNIVVSNVKIYASENEYVWDEKKTDCRSLWPDRADRKIDYVCVKVIGDGYDHDFRVDLDMNR